MVLFGGPDRIRTDDPYNANVMRSQLRYRPISEAYYSTPRGKNQLHQNKSHISSGILPTDSRVETNTPLAAVTWSPS